MSENILERIEHHYRNDPDNMMQVYPGDVLSEVNNLRSQLKASEARSALLAKALEKSLDVMPDCGKRDCWHWAWDELDEEAQDEVKSYRKELESALTLPAQAAAAYLAALEREHEYVKPLMDRDTMTPFISAWEFEPHRLDVDGEKIYDKLKVEHEAVEAARRELNR